MGGWEIYMFEVLVGLNKGPIQAWCIALYTTFVPRGKEACFFGLLVLSDFGTGWFGPFIFNLVKEQLDVTVAFGLLGLTLLGVVCLLEVTICEATGQRAAGRRS